MFQSHTSLHCPLSLMCGTCANIRLHKHRCQRLKGLEKQNNNVSQWNAAKSADRLYDAVKSVRSVPWPGFANVHLMSEFAWQTLSTFLSAMRQHQNGTYQQRQKTGWSFIWKMALTVSKCHSSTVHFQMQKRDKVGTENTAISALCQVWKEMSTEE